MKFFRALLLTFVFIAPLFFVGQAQADLFISPLRVVFEGRDRSALVTLVNRSNEANTYRIGWADKTMLNDGSYQDIESYPKSQKAPQNPSEPWVIDGVLPTKSLDLFLGSERVQNLLNWAQRPLLDQDLSWKLLLKLPI